MFLQRVYFSKPFEYVKEFLFHATACFWAINVKMIIIHTSGWTIYS